MAVSISFETGREVQDFARDDMVFEINGEVIGTAKIEDNIIKIRSFNQNNLVPDIIDINDKPISINPEKNHIYVLKSEEKFPDFPIIIHNMKEDGKMIIKSLSFNPLILRFKSLVDNDSNDIEIYSGKSIELFWIEKEKRWIRLNEVYGRMSCDVELQPLEEKSLKFYGVDLYKSIIMINTLNRDKIKSNINAVSYTIDKNELIMKNGLDCKVNIVLNIIF